MRRFTVPMFLLLAGLSTPLAGQASLLFGYAGTVGGGEWQIEALEFGIAAPVGLGPVRSVAASIRTGWFADQAVLIRGTRGFVGAFALALRSGRLSVTEIGDELNPTVVSLDLSLEGAGYLAANSPIPEGKRWASVAVLPALRVGSADGAQFAFVLGPAFFAGLTRHTHLFLAARGEFPLARRRRGP